MRIEGFNIKTANICDGRELQLTHVTQLVSQPVFAGMSVEAAINASRLAEGLYIPIYTPGLVAMFDSLPYSFNECEDRHSGREARL